MTYQIIRVDAAGASHNREQRVADNVMQALQSAILAWIIENNGARRQDYLIANLIGG